MELDSNDNNTSDEQITTNDDNNNLNDVASYFCRGRRSPNSLIDDFDADRNYYLGLNYTEGMSKTNNGKYTENVLKDVQINYYGYDYNFDRICCSRNL